MDIERNKMNVTQDRIVQRLAMLETDLDLLKNKLKQDKLPSE